MTAVEFLKKENLPTDLLSGDDVNYAMIEFAKLCVIAELKKHIEHPTKPGYKRSDIVARIKELEKQ